MCYIVPNKFYKIVAGQETRKLLSTKIIQLDDFGDMQLFRDKKGGIAVMVVEIDEVIPQEVIDNLVGKPGIIRVKFLSAN